MMVSVEGLRQSCVAQLAGTAPCTRLRCLPELSVSSRRVEKTNLLREEARSGWPTNYRRLELLLALLLVLFLVAPLALLNGMSAVNRPSRRRRDGASLSKAAVPIAFMRFCPLALKRNVGSLSGSAFGSGDGYQQGEALATVATPSPRTKSR